jgi:hypothetical protein
METLDIIDLPAPLKTLDRVRDSMRNTKHVSQALLRARIQRYYFDATDPEDRTVYLVFLRTGKWIKQYYFEMPDQNAVAMCQRKLIEYVLRDEVEKAQPIIDGIDASKSQTYRAD